MTRIDSHPAGTFCWAELATTDSVAAKQFYGGLFGWSYVDNPMPGGAYTMAQIEGSNAGAMWQLTPDMRAAGAPAQWAVYVAVDSVEEALSRVKTAGGAVTMPPHDIPGAGRMAGLRDPQGATFNVWQAAGHCGTEAADVHGSPCWMELTTPDMAGAKAFYTAVFAWEAGEMDMGPMGVYTLWQRGGAMVAGGMEMAEAPPNWMIYFNVDDCDATFAKALEAGAKEMVPPTDIPGTGRFATLTDPQGVCFSIIRMG